MRPAVKIDESLSDLVGQPFADAGYEVRSVRSQGWSGVKDSALWPMVQAERVLFATADIGFGDARAHPPGSHHGVIVLRADSQSVVTFRAVAPAVIDRFLLEDLHRCTVVASPGVIRVSRPPTRR